MKAVDNPEFILIKRIQMIKEKYKDIPEIAELEEEALGIINQNCVSSVQMSMMYLLSSEGVLDKKTEEKIKDILQSVLGREKNEMGSPNK